MRNLAPSMVVLGAAVVACSRPATAPMKPCPAAAAPIGTAEPTLQPASDDLARLARLEGDWRGEGQGEPGTATVERSYRWVLGGKFLESRNRSTYAPQPSNPKGEIHEDRGYISHDKARKLLVSRQFTSRVS